MNSKHQAIPHQAHQLAPELDVRYQHLRKKLIEFESSDAEWSTELDLAIRDLQTVVALMGEYCSPSQPDSDLEEDD